MRALVIRDDIGRSSGYGCISETIASRTAFSRPLARSSIPVATLGIGCSAKPDAFDPCVPIPGSNGSAINQVGIRPRLRDRLGGGITCVNFSKLSMVRG